MFVFSSLLFSSPFSSINSFSPFPLPSPLPLPPPSSPLPPSPFPPRSPSHQNLSTLTSEADEDFPKMKQLIQEMKKLQENINKSLESSDRMSQLINIDKKIIDFPEVCFFLHSLPSSP